MIDPKPELSDGSDWAVGLWDLKDGGEDVR